MTPITYTPTFGDALRSVRRARGLSQSDLAEILGISNGTISNWETGSTHFVNKEHRQQLAFALGQPPDFFEGMLFGKQFKPGVEPNTDFSSALMQAAEKLSVVEDIRNLRRADSQNLLSHAPATHNVSSPHNGIMGDKIVPIHGAGRYPSDVQYAVRIIQRIYEDWLYHPEKTGDHWWFYLAEVLLHELTTDDFARLRLTLPTGPDRPPQTTVTRADDV